MFHTPKNFSVHLQHFIPYQDGVRMIEEINAILRSTAFPNRQCNLCILICSFLSFFSMMYHFGLIFSPGDSGSDVQVSIGWLLWGMLSPYVIYIGLMQYKKHSRKINLLNYVQEWNGKKNDGVSIFLGGGGTVRGVTVGSDTGGTYENFYMATWDPKSLLVRGYLHVFVNYQERSNWCQQNNIAFVPPVPPHQQTMAQQIAPQSQVPTVPVGFQVPAGYALVPENYQPPQEFQVPPGYALVLQNQDLPPDYDTASKM